MNASTAKGELTAFVKTIYCVFLFISNIMSIMLIIPNISNILYIKKISKQVSKQIGKLKEEKE